MYMEDQDSIFVTTKRIHFLWSFQIGTSKYVYWRTMEWMQSACYAQLRICVMVAIFNFYSVRNMFFR